MVQVEKRDIEELDLMTQYLNVSFLTETIWFKLKRDIGGFDLMTQYYDGSKGSRTLRPRKLRPNGIYAQRN